ncbi:MAG: hypothetical protein NTW86_01790, partial [Candidatus Sumerlaeota bacterium]|nr:hypothetical protein [Candidatus Sumerlaeota bacterium]
MAAVARADEPPAVKWHPGHYVLDDAGPRDEDFAAPFRGLQKRYDWKDLEPQQDQYDFSAIKKDLESLRQRGKYLVIQLQTKAFGKGAVVAPKYLERPEFEGGFYRTETESFNPVIWNDKVNARVMALYAALGREFDSDPTLEAVVIPETAPSSDICRGKPQEGVAPYTLEKFTQALKDGMIAMKK